MLMDLWLSLPIRIGWLDKIIIFKYVKKYHPELYNEIKDYIPLVR